MAAHTEDTEDTENQSQSGLHSETLSPEKEKKSPRAREKVSRNRMEHRGKGKNRIHSGLAELGWLRNTLSMYYLCAKKYRYVKI